MSPILKRDISEHARQARKLASVLTGERAPSPEGSWNNEPSSSTLVSLDSPRIEPGNGSIATGRKINEILDRDRHVTDLNKEEDSGQVLGRVESDEHQRMLQSPWSGQVERMGFLDAHDDGLNTSWKAQGGQWADLKSLLMGVS
ncbi:hypothetical protein BD324DRAFT_183214 [Kockovaella imperatae]|uniref:Uncharacterized protein n=1 Tax=Kockovaella imperatae TaxID=4999 RepID=A0A1Y1UA07_9TREE|nr:hypothetical protein BD324DRAFT_183214 [Kockovaella imperatae]ORX33915.1 hypothetical protein BD324DRAFT_183214 [Kockovaella imperatae]